MPLDWSCSKKSGNDVTRMALRWTTGGKASIGDMVGNG